MTPVVDEVVVATEEWAEGVLREGQGVFGLENNFPNFSFAKRFVVGVFLLLFLFLICPFRGRKRKTRDDDGRGKKKRREETESEREKEMEVDKTPPASAPPAVPASAPPPVSPSPPNENPLLNL